MEQRQVTFMDSLNNFAFGMYLAIIGAVSYVFIKLSKKLIDLLCESIMDKYVHSIRKEADEHLTPFKEEIRQEIKSIKDDIKDEKRRRHDSIAKNEGVLAMALDQLEIYDKKLNEKTTINIPTTNNKRPSGS